MENLLKVIKKELTTKLNQDIESIKQIKDKQEILNYWYYSDKLTKLRLTQLKKDLITLDQVKEILIKACNKRYTKELTKQIDKINLIKNAPNLESISINTQWSKNTYGNQCSCEIKVKNNDCYVYYKGNKTGDYGYDKESTTISAALNQCTSLLKLLYELKDKNINTSNRDLFGYGSGYGLLPYFESAVGTNCFYKIFNTIGYNMEHIANGKLYDVYVITKK